MAYLLTATPPQKIVSVIVCKYQEPYERNLACIYSYQVALFCATGSGGGGSTIVIFDYGGSTNTGRMSGTYPFGRGTARRREAQDLLLLRREFGLPSVDSIDSRGSEPLQTSCPTVGYASASSQRCTFTRGQ